MKKKWFPNEFTQHINYQFGLLKKAMVEIELEYLNAAEKTYELYSALDVKDEYIREYSKKIPEKITNKFLEMSGLTDEILLENLDGAEILQYSNSTKSLNLTKGDSKHQSMGLSEKRPAEKNLTSEFPPTKRNLSMIILMIFCFLALALLFLKFKNKIYGDRYGY